MHGQHQNQHHEILIVFALHMVSSKFCTIVGGGCIGSILQQGGESLLLKRGDKIPSDHEGTPILIATRNDALDRMIKDCPPNHLNDLVFCKMVILMII